ncbi:MAG: hypothetical protein H0X45_04155 [Planctomycetes bacterium]|nr:hypothetical protein [Planctomycetota bacterium]
MRSTQTRSGSALLMAMFACMLAISLIVLAADNVSALAKTQALDGSRQQAAMAAEAVASLIEARLVAQAAETERLQNNIVDEAANYWNLRGYCDGIDQNGDGHDDENAPMWFNGCAVRWRLEPVKVYAATAGDPAALAGQVFMVNPVADPAQESAREVAASGADLANLLMPSDPQTYHFRIITEAWSLREPDDITARPWRDPTVGICHAQAQRVAQLQCQNLFRYALFHAAPSPVGDIEMSTGTTLAVRGAVHSNAAIYFSGGDNGGLIVSPRDYHRNASGSVASPGQRVEISGQAAADDTSVTGVAGLFRMSKLGNLLAVADGIAGASPNPWLVPKTGQGGMTGVNDLNGDAPGSNRHWINRAFFHCDNDSRTAFGAGGMTATFRGLVKDSQTGGRPVNTLSNIPQLGGRPFEAHVIAGGLALYLRNGFGAYDPAGWTLDSANALRLYYDRVPTAAGAVVSTTPSIWPVLATDLPLYWTDATRTRRDVSTTLAPVVGNPGDSDAGFDSREVKSWYLEKALFGRSGSSMAADAVAGLVFRERPRQNPVLAMPADITDLAVAPSAAVKAAWVAYLTSQYVVYFAGRDVTAALFADIATAATYGDFICTEDEFVDTRENLHLQRFYSSINLAAYPAGGIAPPHRTNVLTLNLRRIQDVLRTWPMTRFGSAAASLANAHFNGLIYAARTRRSSSYHPVLRPDLILDLGPDPENYVFRTNNPYTNPAGPLTDIREGVGPVETKRGHVRVRGGADINWNTAASGVTALGTSGLTMVSPDRVYLWGDYNVTNRPDAGGTPRTPPCAVFADGLVALSNAWLDANNRIFTPTTTAAVKYSGVSAASTRYITSMVINNVPTEGWNAEAGGTGGCSNMIRFLENWRDRTITLRGSAVVLNAQRYSRGALAYAYFPLHMNAAVYRPPTRDIQFNTDLLMQAGQPPFSPFGVQVTRVVSLVNTLDN